ncbi:hypothetical protein BASA60_002830 [Batrachochytrium salamandrivorans]|nr:hypothetical protein BASA60_002830 [Batrachochytrium salamandrivorans]
MPVSASSEAVEGIPFVLPTIADNPGSWGPNTASLPAHIQQVPYAPFVKADRVGRIADWTAPLGPDGLPYESRRYDNDYHSSSRTGPGASAPGGRRGGNVSGGGRNAAAAAAAAAAAGGDASFSSAAVASSAFAYQHSAEDDASFSVVDRATAPTLRNKPAGGGRGAFGGRGGASSRGGSGGRGASASGGAWGSGGRASAAVSNNMTAAGSGKTYGSAATAASSSSTAAATNNNNSGGRNQSGGAPGGRRGGGRFGDRQARVRDPSIKIDPNWIVVDELDFARLSKLYYECDDPTDIAVCGSLQYIDKAYERITSKNERPLQITQKAHRNLTASDDPLLQEFAKTAAGHTIIATDFVLAALMASTRSVNSFDIIVTKRGDVVYLDKRDGGILDLATVNENASDPPMDGPDKATNINGPLALAHEAININRSYSQQVLRELERVNFTQSSPFAHGEPVEALVSAAYRYRSWETRRNHTYCSHTT